MGVKDLYKFPFPTPPSQKKLHTALRHLTQLKSIEHYEDD